jgi:hypothetical protein
VKAIWGVRTGWTRLKICASADVRNEIGPEMLLPIWLRLWGALKTPMFNFKIAR